MLETINNINGIMAKLPKEYFYFLYLVIHLNDRIKSPIEGSK